MKYFNKQILEAVNQGIKFALDDFDNEPIMTQKIGKIEDENYTKAAIEFYRLQDIINKINESRGKNSFGLFYDMIWNAYSENKLIDKTYLQKSLAHISEDVISNDDIDFLLQQFEKYNIFDREYANLDLPSGILWCTRNLGGSDQIDLGNRYLWSETEPVDEEHSSFNESIRLPNNYEDKIASDYEVTLYLENKHDAAYKVNNHYKIPTGNNFKELFKYTDVYETFNGVFCISKENPLNFIFFNQANILYLTSEITNFNKNNKMEKSSKYKFFIYLIRLYKNGETNLSEIPFRSLHDYKIPPTKGFIRPIYIKMAPN